MLLTGMILLSLFLGIAAGYVGVRAWRTIKGTSEGWRSVAWSTACFFPGIVFVILLLLVTVCAEVSVVLTYMHLCVEDWMWWWWKAFYASGSVALNVFLYSINYLVFDLGYTLPWLLFDNGCCDHAVNWHYWLPHIILLCALSFLISED